MHILELFFTAKVLRLQLYSAVVNFIYISYTCRLSLKRVTLIYSLCDMIFHKVGYKSKQINHEIINGIQRRKIDRGVVVYDLELYKSCQGKSQLSIVYDRCMVA